MRNRNIFGKEPAFWVSTIQLVLLALMSINSIKGDLGLSDERVALIMVVVNALSAVYLAWAMRETMLAALIEVVKGVVALLVAYGLEFTTDQMNLIMGTIALVGGAYLRDQASPLVRPSFSNPPNAPVLTAAPPQAA